MSDSDQDQPSAATISNKLRDIVIDIHGSGNSSDLTVKRVRARAERELGLEDGFFKTDSNWKQKSQQEIVEAVNKYCHVDSSPQSTPKKATPKPKAQPRGKDAKATDKSAQGTKRKAAAPTRKPAKKRKPSSDEESEAELSELSAESSTRESDPPKKPARRAKKIVTEDSEEEEEAPKSDIKGAMDVDGAESDAEPTESLKKTEARGDISDSDLSSVIDEEPVKKQRKKKDTSAPAKKQSKPKLAKAKVENDPEQARIKELQGWLVKCGIRKVWSKDPELSKCSTSKEKISVLKNMLKDVGMDGKFSVEKAAKIKEKREFAKDLEAIKEGELAWGQTTEVTTTGRPSRRAAARSAPVQKIVLEDDSDEDMDSGDHHSEGSSHGGEDDEDDEDDGVKSDSDGQSE